MFKSPRARAVLLSASLVAAGCVALATLADAEPTAELVGQAAPAFRLNNQAGTAVAIFDKKPGAWTVLAFFPRALTGG